MGNGRRKPGEFDDAASTFEWEPPTDTPDQLVDQFSAFHDGYPGYLQFYRTKVVFSKLRLRLGDVSAIYEKRGMVGMSSFVLRMHHAGVHEAEPEEYEFTLPFAHTEGLTLIRELWFMRRKATDFVVRPASFLAQSGLSPDLSGIGKLMLDTRRTWFFQVRTRLFSPHVTSLSHLRERSHLRPYTLCPPIHARGYPPNLFPPLCHETFSKWLWADDISFLVAGSFMVL
eukprot:1189158-Prorocentrum_minimum.AAC.2